MTAAGRQAHAVLHVPRCAALAAIAVLVASASLVSFAESYRGLYTWAHRHGLTGAWAVIWPLQVDVFIAVGELALFVALADRWPSRSRGAAWAVALAGLAASVAGNVGHVAGHAMPDRITAAVPPLAAASALAVGLGVLKRVVAARHADRDAQPHPQAAPERAAVPALAQSGGALALGAPVPAPADRTRPAPAGTGAPGSTRLRAASPGRARSVSDESAEVHFAAALADGQVPSRRRIKAELHVGQDRAAQIHDHLAALAVTPDGQPREHSGSTP